MDQEKREGEEGQAFLDDSSESDLQKPFAVDRRRRRALGCIRVVIEILMAVAIVFFLVAKPQCGRDTIRKTPVPKREQT
jgi:hypothetical protein